MLKIHNKKSILLPSGKRYMIKGIFGYWIGRYKILIMTTNMNSDYGKFSTIQWLVLEYKSVYSESLSVLFYSNITNIQIEQRPTSV